MPLPPGCTPSFRGSNGAAACRHSFVLVLTALSCPLASATRLTAPWTHGWGTALDAQFIDTGYSRLTEAQANWTAQHYAIYSVEKCTGYSAARKTYTEAAVYDTAAQLKRYSPGMRVLFYLHAEVISLNCYAAFSTYLQHPEWWLYDDAGAVMNNSGQSAMIPLLDYTVPAACAFWVSIPLNGTGSPAAAVVDGVLADGTGTKTNFCGGARIGAARCAALVAAKATMVAEMQALLNATNGGSVLQNGLDSAPGLVTLGAANGVMAEHFVAFEYVTHGAGTWSYNAPAIAAYMDRVAAATAAGKTVVVACWVGPASVPFTALGFPSWPLGDAPTTLPGWRAALLAWHPFALAAYLTVAQENVWMQYEGCEWAFGSGPCATVRAPPASLAAGYTQWQGAIGCNGDATCVAPEPWYADLYEPLGAPLGPPTRVNNSWTRRFERAVSFLDLDAPNTSGVTWLSATATGSASPSATPSVSSTPSPTGTSSGSGSATGTATATRSPTATPSATTTGTGTVSSTASGSSQSSPAHAPTTTAVVSVPGTWPRRLCQRNRLLQK